ncbi:hypothetical protein ACFQX6_02915 [Streptosporangium lutulentum]
MLEVALASDGYLSAAERLRHAEDELAASLRADPMRIGAHPSTKGLTPGTVSFDDRTYVRVRRSADDTVAAADVNDGVTTGRRRVGAGHT